MENKKLSKRKQEIYYDTTYTILDYMFKLYNPCQFKKLKKPLVIEYKKYHENGNKSYYSKHVKTLTHNCINARTTKSGLYSPVSCCTVHCKHLTIKGCNVKSLGCKLYMCLTIKEKYPKLKELRNMLQTMLCNQLRMITNCHYSKAKSLHCMQNNWKDDE